jgi:MoaA/NifB/PqqE/SkfB family radical SAM enzyme
MTTGELRKADESLRNFAGKEVRSACYAPFVSLYLTPTGVVQACCRNQTFVLGDIREQRLAEIWNGGRIAALRQALTDYKFGLGCTYCEWESERRSDSFAIRLMSDEFPVASPQPDWPAMIEFNGSNACNLECIMCCGEYSSAIRSNQEGLPPLPKVYNDQFFEDLRHFLPHLRFLNFLGGEPFLTQEAHRVWEMMIEGDLSIPCRVTTNGTLHNARIERVMNAVPMHITVSLDGVTKETFESIRHRANFETVMANLHRFHAYTRGRGTNFGISYCLMRQNWHELADMILLAERLDCELSIVMVAGPSHCSLFTLPPQELQHVIQQIAVAGHAIAPELRRHRKAWEETVQHLRAAAEPEQTRKIEAVVSFDLLADNPIARARRLAAEGDIDMALSKLQQVQPGHADYYFALALSGYLRGRQGDLTGAAQDLEKALHISRKLPDAYLNLARVHFRQRRLNAALENVLQAKARVVPEERIESEVLVLSALIWARRGRLWQAYEAYARLAALPPPSRQGVAVPDSLKGALQCLAEVCGDSKGIGARLLALCSRLLYHAASANRKMQPHISPPVSVAAPGVAQLHLLPAAAEIAGRWSLRVAGVKNRARLVSPAEGQNTVRIAIEQAGSGVAYDIQLNYGRISFDLDSPYRIRFRIRADQPRTVGFGVARAIAPWSNLGCYQTLEAGTSWLDVEVEFVAAAAEETGRLHFDLGESSIPFEVDSLTVGRAR